MGIWQSQAQSDSSQEEKDASFSEKNVESPQTYTEQDDLEANLHELHRLESLNHSFPMNNMEEEDIVAKIMTGNSAAKHLHQEVDEIDPDEFGGGRLMPPYVGDQKQYQIDFSGPDDPDHPLNWTLKRKIKVSVPIALYALTCAWGSSIFSVTESVLSEQFHVAPVVIELGVTLYVLGFAAGPIVWSPMSELYGRKPTFFLSMFLFVCFVFASATAENLQTLMITRFFSGMTGSSPFTVASPTFADMYGPRIRGRVIKIFCITLFCGPLLAPIVGGFVVTSYLGWRWLLYLTGIMGGFVFILSIFCLEETFAAIILVEKAQRLREKSGNWAIHAAHENVKPNFKEIITKNIARPLKMVFTEPLLYCVSIYNGFCYAILYLLLSSYPYAFIEKYRWPLEHAEIPYIGVLIGMMIVILVMELFYEPRYLAKLTPGTRPEPEERLKPMKLAGISFCIGLFFFFWSANYPDKVHWAVPTISGLFTGFGILGVLVPSIIFIVECYLVFSASALAGLTFLRSAMGAASPLFATFMYEKLGLNWSGLLLGLVAVVLACVPFLFGIYGKSLRKRSKFAFDI